MTQIYTMPGLPAHQSNAAAALMLMRGLGVVGQGKQRRAESETSSILLDALRGGGDVRSNLLSALDERQENRPTGIMGILDAANPFSPARGSTQAGDMALRMLLSKALTPDTGLLGRQLQGAHQDVGSYEREAREAQKALDYELTRQTVIPENVPPLRRKAKRARRVVKEARYNRRSAAAGQPLAPGPEAVVDEQDRQQREEQYARDRLHREFTQPELSRPGGMRVGSPEYAAYARRQGWDTGGGRPQPIPRGNGQPLDSDTALAIMADPQVNGDKAKARQLALDLGYTLPEQPAEAVTEGTIAHNPTTGERIIMRNGAWLKLLTTALVRQILDEAGGDPDVAERIARERGYDPNTQPQPAGAGR